MKLKATGEWLKSYRIECVAFLLYLVGVCALNWLHSLWGDEMQAWLIVRDSHTFASLLHNLHYEAHPLLWYLALYPLVKLGAAAGSLKAVNALFSLVEAILILSAVEVPRSLRILFIFSLYLLFDYAVVGRNYMLAVLLLTVALRLLLLEQPRRWLALVALILAINTHFFAIPLAGLLFVYGFFVRTEKAALRKRVFSGSALLAGILFLLAIFAAYLTIKPAPDSYTPWYGTERHSVAYNFFLAEGKAWQMLLPIPAAQMPGRLYELLVPRFQLALGGCVLTALLLGFLLLGYRTRNGKLFFLLAVLGELMAMALTVHAAPLRHYGMLYVGLIFALMIDRNENQTVQRAWRQWLLFAIFLPQAVLGIVSAVYATRVPFSEGKAAADWIQAHGYAENPMIAEPDIQGAVVLGYLNRTQAYYPTCRCFGSFAVWNRTRNENAQASDAEFRAISGGSSVLLMSKGRVEPERMARQHLEPLVEFNQPTVMHENYFLYLWRPLDDESAAGKAQQVQE